jgi:ribulose-bisphosphate carboxylase large chain
MNREDIKAFFAEEECLDTERFVIETYWFETGDDPRLAAAALCSEQSTAQWKRPGSKEDLRTLYGAKVIGLEVLDVSNESVCAQVRLSEKKYSRCLVRIAHPHINFGPKIPNLITAVCGEGAFHSPYITAIKLLDLAFPDSYLSFFEGPKFGAEEIKKRLKAADRPVFLGVVKPNIGLSPDEFAAIAYEGWLGGLDVAKDDEMQADSPVSPLRYRLKLVNKKRIEAEQKTGEPKIFLANITDEVDRLRELHDIAVENGAGAVMINGMTTGLSAVRMLAKHAAVPVVGHFDFIAPFTRMPFFGVSSTLIDKLQRIAGCDAIIMPGFGSRMMTAEEDVKASVDVCLGALGNLKRALPVPGGGDWAGTLPGVYEKLRTIDFGFIMGRGVFDHPMGPAAGARSARQAWEAVIRRIPLEEFAKDHLELYQAVKTFGESRKGGVHVPVLCDEEKEEAASKMSS